VAFSQTRLLVRKGVSVDGTSTRRDRLLKGKAYNSTAIRQQILILSLLQAKVVPPRTFILSSEILKLVSQQPSRVVLSLPLFAVLGQALRQRLKQVLRPGFQIRQVFVGSGFTDDRPR